MVALIPPRASLNLMASMTLGARMRLPGCFGSIDGESSVVIDMTTVTLIHLMFRGRMRHIYVPRWYVSINKARRCQ